MTKFYLTTAIAYINGPPGLHHIYEVLGADVLARYHRMVGDDTFFLTGTDEHGQKVERAAIAAGEPPRAFSDRMSGVFRDAMAQYGISYDRFIRTEDPDHVKGVLELLGKIMAKGDIYKGRYEGWYCVSCEAFYEEEELHDGFCPIHPSVKATWLHEDNYFFALSRYQDRLTEHIERHPRFIEPESRRNEILGWLRRGLQDFSISRQTVKWGIPFPGDPSQVIYVWGDALVNYVTGVGYGTDEQKFKRWWPADLHIIGKDILRFHVLYWPAMLMSAGIPLPKQVWGHGWLTSRGERMSKTAGTSIDPMDAAGRLGVEGVRYLLLREAPFDRDADIIWEGLVERFNADLANDLGNFVYRSLSMLQRYFDGKVPAPDGDATRLDAELRKAFEKAVKSLGPRLKALDYTGALAAIWAAVNRGNKYIEESAPWVLAKQSDQRKRLQTVMYNLAEAIRLTSFLISPFMPETAQKIAGQVKADLKMPWDKAQEWGGMAPRTQTSLGGVLFPRIEKEPVGTPS